jgi:hypothetical protein
MAETKGTDYFFRGHPLTGVQVRASLMVRRRIYEWLRTEVGGFAGKVVLDHGTTPDTERGDSNCMIGWLLADGAIVHAASPEDVSSLPRKYPGLCVLPWPPTRASLADVDCIVSSAVLEHVGPEESQVRYLCDLLCLRRPFLLTTPNRGHWLEFHTKLPLLHWLPRNAHRAILSLLGLGAWASEEQLRLLGRTELSQLLAAAMAQTGQSAEVAWYRPRFLGAVSNLVILVRPRDGAS